jgi:hypothetical protein
MSVKSRVETLEKRAGAASGNPKVFIVSARPDADRPDLYNLECGGSRRVSGAVTGRYRQPGERYNPRR